MNVFRRRGNRVYWILYLNSELCPGAYHRESVFNLCVKFCVPKKNPRLYLPSLSLPPAPPRGLLSAGAFLPWHFSRAIYTASLDSDTGHYARSP